MTQSIAILGRQPALGLAELESLYGADKIQQIGNNAAALDVPVQEIDINRLGGSIKIAKLLTVIDSTNWKDIEKYLIDKFPDHVCCLPEGKLLLGLSVYGLSVSVKQINITALKLKKVTQANGHSARIIPNKTPEISSAQVLHNKLFTVLGWDLLLIKHRNQTYLAQTTAVQDINAYTARDQARPKRDARVGMLPPKLAQIIINLANPPENAMVLDPFCGTGVVLQEALLMGYGAYGTDLEPRMVEYSKANLEWLKVGSNWQVEQADATTAKWDKFHAIAAETYLGRPFSALPAPEVLSEVMKDVDTIIKKFLQNLSQQTSSGFRLCIAVPAWKTKSGFSHLKLLDNLGDLGYTRAVFTHADSKTMVYHRPEQIVGRELVVLIRK